MKAYDKVSKMIYQLRDRGLFPELDGGEGANWQDKHTPFVYELLTLRRLANKHHKLAEMSCNGEGSIRGTFYSWDNSITWAKSPATATPDKVKDNEVLICAASNNVRPLYFTEEKCSSLSEILQKEGKDALELEVFKQYENGNFQRGGAKYLRALAVLRHMPEYERFNWRTKRDNEKRELRVSKEFDALLMRALKTRLPKDRFVLSKDYFGKRVYLHKMTRHYAKWNPDKEKAKVFRFEADAIGIKKCFTGSDEWLVEVA